MLFVLIFRCIEVNKEILIADVANIDWQLAAGVGKLRMQFFPHVDNHNVTDDNAAVIEKAREGIYKIRFGLGKYMYKKKDPGVVAVEEDDPIVEKEGKEGLYWKIVEGNGKVKFISKDTCLDIMGFDSTNENKYLNGSKCDENSKKQDFVILDANIKKEPEEVSNEKPEEPVEDNDTQDQKDDPKALDDEQKEEPQALTKDQDPLNADLEKVNPYEPVTDKELKDKGKKPASDGLQTEKPDKKEKHGAEKKDSDKSKRCLAYCKNNKIFQSPVMPKKIIKYVNDGSNQVRTIRKIKNC